MKQWAIDLGVRPALLRGRLGRGWPIEKVLTTTLTTWRRCGGYPRKLTNSQELEVLREYQGGMGATLLARKYVCSEPVIQRALTKHGVTRRSTIESARKYAFAEHAFDELTTEAAYWIGFIASDGNVSDRGYSPCISIGLSLKDIGQLQKFKAFARAEHPITILPNAAAIQIYSQRWGERLRDFGIGPRKSFIYRPPDSIVFNKHFWRGMIDGDGYVIHKRNGYPIVGLVGSHDTLAQFGRFLDSLQLYNPRYQSRRKYIPKKHCNIWAISLGGYRAVQLARYLYTDEPSLARKAATARSFQLPS